MIPFAMIGAGGRMGRTIIALADSDFSTDVRLSGALERAGSPALGKDAGEWSGVGRSGITITDKPDEALRGARVAIDFSHPESTLSAAAHCAAEGIALAVGTTGLTADQQKTLRGYAEKIPLLISPNMSFGVNTLFALVEEAARRLTSGYDVEVTETHHRMKKDAPSGTAARLKEILVKEYNRTEKDIVYGRQGMPGERTATEIGIHALRGGDVVGDHTVYFFTNGERIELTHRASSRNAFASGAIRAAMFLAGGTPGLYTMKDVLGGRV